MRLVWRAGIGCVLVTSIAATAAAQTVLTWPDVRARLQATNPTLLAGQIGIDESRATETTAYLRPNPLFSITLDQVGNTESGNIFSASTLSTAVSYLHERQHKRELRRDSAQGATAIATSAQADLGRETSRKSTSIGWSSSA